MSKVNVSLPDDLLAHVDELARELDRSRSGLVQEATAQYVTRVHAEQAEAERQRSIEAAMSAAREISTRIPAGGDTTDLIRADRDGDYGNRPADE